MRSREKPLTSMRKEKEKVSIYTNQRKNFIFNFFFFFFSLIQLIFHFNEPEFVASMSDFSREHITYLIKKTEKK